MTVQVTTIMRPKEGRLEEALRYCRDSTQIAEGHGGKTRVFSAMAAGPGTGELVAVTEFDSMEQYGKLVDQGPPREIIERLRKGDSAPVELVSMNIGVEVKTPSDV